MVFSSIFFWGGGVLFYAFCNFILDMGRARRTGAYGSSHLSRYKSSYKNRNNPKSPFRAKFGKFSQVKSCGGLSVMPVRFDRYTLKRISEDSEFYKEKVRQLEEITLALERGEDVEALWVALSNDYKAFITNHLGKLLPLNKGAIEKWEKLKSEKGKRVGYNAFDKRPWSWKLRKQLMAQFGVYKDVLASILSRSSLKVLHHSSILERLNPAIEHLDFYFAVLNSVLQRHLERWSREEVFKNKHGEPIVCKFVNVKEQFCLAPEPELLFRPREVADRGELTHRNDEAMDVIADIWSSVAADSG